MSEANSTSIPSGPAASTASTAVTAPATNLTAADVHDRVAEAYFGKMGDAFMRETQERIHWICARVEGERVLDVGCSQGITTLLLAREGKQVTGIDVDAKAIGEARALISQEPDRVQQCARLENADFLSLPAPKKLFDSMVMSEVLEHLVQPQAFIEAAPRFLKPGGRLVVTVPFGVNDFVDHKHTFYLLQPLRLLASRFSVEEVEVLGKWIGFAARLRTDTAAAADLSMLEARLVSDLEAGFEVLERSIRSEAQSYRAKLHDANLKYRSVTEQVATYKQRLVREEAACKQATANAQELQVRLEAMQLAIDNAAHERTTSQAHETKLKTELESLHAERNRVQNDLFEARLQLTRAGAQLEELRERLAAQDRQLQHWSQVLSDQLPVSAAQASAQLASFAQIQRDLLAELQGQRQSHAVEREQWQRQLKEASRSVEAVRQSSLDERTALLDETSRLQQTVDSLISEVGELRSRLAIKEGELDIAAAERLRLGRELIELQGSHQALEDQLRELRSQLDAEVQERLQRVAFLESQLREAQAQASALQLRLAETLEALGQAREMQSHAEARLQQTIDQWKAESAEQQQRLLTLSSELDTERAVGRDYRLSKEKQQLQLLQAKRHTDDLRDQLERTRQLRQAAEEQVVRTRSTFSFRLGYALLHGFKSVDAMLRLPGQLWALHREGQQRRRQRRDGTLSIRKHGSTPVSTPALPASSIRTVAAQPVPTPAGGLLPRELPASEALRILKVAAIMDEFTRASFAPECNLLSLSVDRWQEELQAFKPDMLFIESAWRGKDDRWGNKVGHLSSEVQGVLAWCREHRVPTAFWNKEDPIHFETFLNTARLFDHVFTTDIDCIPRYKAALEHDRVHLLPFACQPALCNPIEQYERKDAFCFAGAYYVRYPERTRDLGNFVSYLAEYRPVEIFDRNFGKDDPNYRFPPEYQPFIVGTLPFDQIDKAYKGYRYAINLNSIKQSQTMFARRVFELLASNTLTISNFSRGVRTLFGDLVITSDSGPEIVRRLKDLESNPQRAALLRLAGLRKVMQEHTYQDRLAYVVGHLQGRPLGCLLPQVTVTAYAKNQAQWDALWANYQRQAYEPKRLLVLTPNDFVPALADSACSETVRILKAAEVSDSAVTEWVDEHDWVAGMVPDDHYGRYYLTDLAVATRYANGPVVGKGTYAVWSPSQRQQQHRGAAPYSRTASLAARAALVHQPLLLDVGLREWVTSLHTRSVEHEGALATDPFSYCKNGASEAEQLCNLEENEGRAWAVNQGLPIAKVLEMAESLPAHETAVDTAPKLSGVEWSQWFKPPASRAWRCNVEVNAWQFHSELADGQHEYVYAARDVTPDELRANNQFDFHLDTSAGLNIQLAVLFLDANRQRISSAVKAANINHSVPLPAGTAFIRLGLRIYGGGKAKINGIVFGHRPQQRVATLPQAEHLLVTNNYPSYDDLYRNGFVHSRVLAYKERRVMVDVFRFKSDRITSYHEYENVDVTTGSETELDQLLDRGKYKTVLVHFLGSSMWEVLRRRLDQTRVIVWIHGAEIQPWHRRSFNFETNEALTSAKLRSDERISFWRQIFSDAHENLHFVFVSSSFAKEVMQDVGVELREGSYSIIPNPIDTDLFKYQEKAADMRKRILSVRSYASKKYANDLSVQAILELSKLQCFPELEFKIIGDGELFDQTVEPLISFKNVSIERRFLSRTEIAEIQRDYGIFLCPTRWDSQGVSRDEAMSAGLVPVTNRVAAVPEFLDESQGVLAPPEDYVSMAEGITDLIMDANKFLSMSKNSGERIRKTVSKRVIIEAELGLIGAE